MNRLRNKLNSSRGATILLAMLFLLLCMMVCASLLMAAVSNAGKSQRNRVEHQKYLTLSSALQLVCQDLEKAAYQGQYTYTAESVLNEGAAPKLDGTYDPSDYHALHTYTQKPGVFTSQITALSSLSRDLDLLFARHFTLSQSNQTSGDEYKFNRLYQVELDSPDPVFSAADPYELTLTTQVSKTDFPGLGEEKVTVKVQLLQATGAIRLTASLGENPVPGDYYTMEAELLPNKKPWDVLALSPNPRHNNGTDLNKTGDKPGDEPDKEPDETLQWSLNWIAKKEAEVE